MFATKPQLAGDLLLQAHDRGILAAFVAGDEVYGGLDLRRSIRECDTGYVLAVRSNHMVTLPSGRRLTVKNAAGLAGPGRWQRMQLIKGHGHEYDSGEARSSIARGARLTKPGWAQSRARGGWHAKLYRRDAG
jgi:SRSO17 transposase